MRALLTSPLGFLIGISLGALGGGGSILAVPALVYAAGQSPRNATTTSLVLVTLTALIGMVPHWRARRVRVGSGVLFGAVGVGGSLLGSRWNEAVDPDLLLLAFAALMLVAAWAMWRRQRRTPPMLPARSVGAAVAPAQTISSPPSGAATVFKVLAAGSAVGLLTGFFGVGGGFVIVPALVLALGFAMPEAVGTSLLVISINSSVALISRLDSGSIQWHVVGPFAAASLLGVLAGSRVARTRDPASLHRGFVALLVLVAVYTAVRSAIALFAG